jgi:hypothetical protein
MIPLQRTSLYQCNELSLLRIYFTPPQKFVISKFYCIKEILMGTTISGISYQLRDKYSICRCCIYDLTIVSRKWRSFIVSIPLDSEIILFYISVWKLNINVLEAVFVCIFSPSPLSVGFERPHHWYIILQTRILTGCLYCLFSGCIHLRPSPYDHDNFNNTANAGKGRRKILKIPKG